MLIARSKGAVKKILVSVLLAIPVAYVLTSFFWAYLAMEERGRVTSGFRVAWASKEAVNAYYARSQRFPSINQEVDLPPPSQIRSSFVREVAIGTGGVITIRYSQSERLAAATRGRNIVFKPSMGAKRVEWDCTGGDLPDEYRPSSCRK